jgi:hypothetical protein
MSPVFRDSRGIRTSCSFAPTQKKIGAELRLAVATPPRATAGHCLAESQPGFRRQMRESGLAARLLAIPALQWAAAV